MNSIHNIFSTPVYKTRIEATEYDKATVLNEMLDNFSIDPRRNAWDMVEDNKANQYGIIQIMMMTIPNLNQLVMLSLVLLKN